VRFRTRGSNSGMLARLPGTKSEIAHEYQDFFEARLRYLVWIDQPLVLITQAGRSGGSLLLRLFDGHPECHVVPHELGRMVGGLWRPLTDPESAWNALTQENRHDATRWTYRQVKAHERIHGSSERFPFLLPAALQLGLFRYSLAQLENRHDRGVVDAYMTAYFNAWLDNRNLRGARPKTRLVGFEPGIIRKRRKMDAFARVYPDGRVISIVRDPWSWYASARRWSPARWGRLEDALVEWRETVEAALTLKREQPEAVCIVRFADLLQRTEVTMRILTAWLRIDFVPEVLAATFNGLPIGANSSFAGASTEISTAPLTRSESDLSAGDRTAITRLAGEIYERALAMTIDVTVQDGNQEPDTGVVP
jgi:hypothetical protein